MVKQKNEVSHPTQRRCAHACVSMYLIYDYEGEIHHHTDDGEGCCVCVPSACEEHAPRNHGQNETRKHDGAQHEYPSVFASGIVRGATIVHHVGHEEDYYSINNRVTQLPQQYRNIQQLSFSSSVVKHRVGQNELE